MDEAPPEQDTQGSSGKRPGADLGARCFEDFQFHKAMERIFAYRLGYHYRYSFF